MNLWNQHRRFLVAAFLLAMSVCNVTLVFRLVPSLRNGYQDFTIFYSGARLIRNGQASALYDLATQYQEQLTFAHVPIRQGPLPYNHPPFEALLFVPFTLLDYWPAYLLWTAINLIMLAVSVIFLRRHFHRLASIPIFMWGLGATAFYPVTIAIMHGQDVILLLLLFVLAIICLDRGNDATAGALLAAGLFRPQLALPLVVLIAIRRWRVLVGFAPVAVVLVAISMAIVGWNGSIEYVRFVLHLEEIGARAYDPLSVPNLRGLIVGLTGLSVSGRWTAILILGSSLVVFFAALRRIRNGRDSMVFVSSLAVVTTILVSFHALVHDLSLLLPISLFLLFRSVDFGGEKVDVGALFLVFLLFLTPLYAFLLLLVKRFFWFSLVLLWLYLWLLQTPVTEDLPV